MERVERKRRDHEESLCNIPGLSLMLLSKIGITTDRPEVDWDTVKPGSIIFHRNMNLYESDGKFTDYHLQDHMMIWAGREGCIDPKESKGDVIHAVEGKGAMRHTIEHYLNKSVEQSDPLATCQAFHVFEPGIPEIARLVVLIADRWQRIGIPFSPKRLENSMNNSKKVPGNLSKTMQLAFRYKANLPRSNHNGVHCVQFAMECLQVATIIYLGFMSDVTENSPPLDVSVKHADSKLLPETKEGEKAPYQALYDRQISKIGGRPLDERKGLLPPSAVTKSSVEEQNDLRKITKYVPFFDPKNTPIGLVLTLLDKAAGKKTVNFSYSGYIRPGADPVGTEDMLSQQRLFARQYQDKLKRFRSEYETTLGARRAASC